MAKRVLIIGPESTGKSTLTTNLANHYNKNGKNSANIQEYARYWIDTVLNGDMDKLKFEHITHFGLNQMQMVEDAEKYGEYDLIFSDTDAIVSAVFQQVYYDEVEPTLFFTSINEKWDLILFIQPDVPWVDDGQRNLGDKREQVNEIFKRALKKYKYIEVTGSWEDRLKKAIEAVDSILV